MPTCIHMAPATDTRVSSESSPHPGPRFMQPQDRHPLVVALG